jgi:sulfur carrier protein
MTITLNGRPHELAAECSVTALLESLGLAGRPLVVELDQAALLPREYAQAAVRAGARVEIITIAAGG